MNHDPGPDPIPLSPEERELAQRLSRLGPHGEPSPALDARILAAAHGAVAAAPVHRRRRWPVALGVAASLALALGVAWRLRPLPEAPPVRSEADAAFRASAAAPVPEAAPAAQPSPELPSPAAPMVVEGPPAQETPSPAKPLPPPAAKMTASPSEPAVQEQAPVAFDMAAPVPESAAPAPAPPPAPTEAATAAQAADTDIHRAEALQRSAAPAAPPARDAAAEADSAAGNMAGSDEPLDEVPPATADSPEVREAWLERIRELVVAGRTEEARTSLREFVRRYPDQPLPDDLRALER